MSTIPGERGEVTLAIVQIENIRFPQLVEFAVVENEAAGEFRGDGGPAVHIFKCKWDAVTNVFCPIGHDIKVERSIAIDIRQGEGHAAERIFSSGGRRYVRESSLPIVAEAEN